MIVVAASISLTFFLSTSDCSHFIISGCSGHFSLFPDHSGPVHQVLSKYYQVLMTFWVAESTHPHKFNSLLEEFFLKKYLNFEEISL